MTGLVTRIDARLYYCERPALAASLVEQCRARLGTRDLVAERCGVTPQYLGMLCSHKRKPSYAMQVCLEQLAESDPEKRLVDVDAVRYFRRHPSCVLSYIQQAEGVCAGIEPLPALCGVSRQYISALKKGDRLFRYPFQVLLSAIHADWTTPPALRR